MFEAKQHRIVEITEGLLSSAVDCSLWLIAYLGAMSLPQSSYGQLYRAERDADRFLSQINYDMLKHGLAEARRQGMIQKEKRGSRSWPQITKAGKKRLSSLLPVYDEKRVWDGKTYLISYDIPESRKPDRDILREYLCRIGCGKLQDSVYVTPYDPRDLVADFVREHRLTGTIIVSTIGKDGSIGDETLAQLVCRVYGLEALNERYRRWLAVERGREFDQWSVLTYLAILRDDPQLPFGLLPKWWKGDKAYAEITCLIKDMYFQSL